MRAIVAALAICGLAGCNQNTSAGADREAQVEPAPTPAPQMSAAPALAGVDTASMAVETMTDADIASLGQLAGSCKVRLTEVAKPSLTYEDGLRATIKLNGKLITLPHSGASTYSDGGLSVTLHELSGKGDAGLPKMEMIVMFPGAKDEHGFHGYRQCTRDTFG